MTETAQPLNRVAPQTIDLLLTRRSGSAKAMKGPGPSGDQLRQILTAATRVPDHGKLFPWRFILFEGEERKHFGEMLARIVAFENDEASEDRLKIERERFSRAPVVVGVVSRIKEHTPIPEWEQTLSAGAACQTMLMAAHALGFVANWITEWPAYHPAVHESLKLEHGERIAGFVYIGQPVEPLHERIRPKLDDIVTHWRG
jgi:nitroreductase